LTKYDHRQSTKGFSSYNILSSLLRVREENKKRLKVLHAAAVNEKAASLKEIGLRKKC